MKTKHGDYYVFLDVEEFWETVKYWKSKGYTWIHENHPKYNPIVTQNEMPCVLSVSVDKMVPTMMHGVVEPHKEKYFADPTFVKLFNIKMRERKLKRILKKK